MIQFWSVLILMVIQWHYLMQEVLTMMQYRVFRCYLMVPWLLLATIMGQSISVLRLHQPNQHQYCCLMFGLLKQFQLKMLMEMVWLMMMIIVQIRLIPVKKILI